MLRRARDQRLLRIEIIKEKQNQRMLSRAHVKACSREPEIKDYSEEKLSKNLREELLVPRSTTLTFTKIEKSKQSYVRILKS